MRKFKKTLGIIAGIGAAVYAGLFAVFYFDLDGKALFYMVEPFLKKHYDGMERRDILKQNYDIGKFPKYEYDVK